MRGHFFSCIQSKLTTKWMHETLSVPVADSLVMYYYLGDQTAALRNGKGLYYFSVETWREVRCGWFSRILEFEVTFKETVCEDVDWINLALDKYCGGIKHFSFHGGVEFLVYNYQFLKLECLPYSASRGWERLVQITGVRQCRTGPGAQLSCQWFCVSGKCFCLLFVQINPFSPSLSHSANEIQSFRYIVKIFSWFTLGGGGEEKKKISLGTQPPLGGPGPPWLLWRGCALPCFAA